MHSSNTRCGWTPTPDPAPSPQYGFSPPPSDLFDDPHLCAIGAGSFRASTGASGAEGPPPHNYQGRLEVVGPASGPSQFRPPVVGGDLLLSAIEGSSAYTPDLRLSPSSLRLREHDRPFFPPATPTHIPEINNNINTPYEPAFPPYSRPAIDISWGIHPNESGDFSASTATNRSLRDSHIAITSLVASSIYSTSSSQTPVTTSLGIYPSNRPPNHSGSIDPFSDYGHRRAPSDFRSGRQGRQHIAAVSPIASSQVSAPRRTTKKHWCEVCGTGFAQRQGLVRHHKDVHGSRQLCPHCGDFKWSPGRRYALKKHFEEEHPGVALPEILR